ncbi:hypothetical protein [uncultured Tateyamaria sp.]|uniref:hypothetical protein n=1 Tax=Tateyamaria sp. 1078 TaxID=3417464 RepID=UPI002619819F|nr:hypothetical protein [uncultured Tateyamaria sp.]
MSPLGQYQWPRSETEQTIGHLFDKVKMAFGGGQDDAAIDTAELERRSDDALEAAIREALGAVLHDVLDDGYLGWARQDVEGQAKRLFVHPPMDANVLSDWAKRRDIPVLSEVAQLRNLSNAPSLVVPNLERFFGRQVDQLAPLFEVFDALAAHSGRVLVGCNSWAFRFLEQFDEVQLLFGQGHTFPAFDAEALAIVLEQGIGAKATVKSVETGQSIFERDGDGALNDPFLKDLAQGSLGHPWVAAEMLLQGMAEATEEDKDTSDSQLWVQLPAACSVPSSARDAHLFALHSLLIHGPRKVADLDQLLPNPPSNGVWSSLHRNGFVNLKDDLVSCAIRNYPDIRSELSAAGFNLDRL